MSRTVRTALRTAAVCVSVAAVTIGVAPWSSATTSTLKTVATGLSSPRHLTLHDGKLYVAEAGRGGSGPCVAGPEGQACFGKTGSVSVLDHGKVRQVVKNLPSAAGPDGSGGAGPADVEFVRGDIAILSQTLAIDPKTGANPFGPQGAALGRLSFWDGKHLKLGPDFGAFEAKNNPDKGAGAGDQPVIDSDPYGMTRYRDGFAVVDAAANDLLYVDGRGRISVLAVFPVKMAPAPPALGLPPGTKIPMQSVPTSVVVGPDGALYVSELSSIGVGVARVWRVVPGHTPKIYADGLTALTDLAFDRKGRLLVVTFAKDGIAAPPSDGVLTRIEKNGKKTVLASAGLSEATGLAIDGDTVYLANHGASPSPTGSIEKLTVRG
ncbi:ScyD/ScyE family protein [Amycolatopsis rhabdoformis]|uniref:ScyD/ScyE family protein n=1 Tax=Amycolatopsis rhabdoformis TaxID=1448059 RepID=A0ABZ1IAA2_9PSEU|nr:ScyD/ScyE family protein [Amycolatopsis rhabdoformis]WSE30671.1 ScyD/ScyE family protein [Amycolatopsis rhabdoformis]